MNKRLPYQKKGPVRVALPFAQSPSIEIPGYRFGPFTIHRTGRGYRDWPEGTIRWRTRPGSGWTITHARSGFACFEHIHWKHVGEACVWLLSTTARWSDPRPSIREQEREKLQELLKGWRV